MPTVEQYDSLIKRSKDDDETRLKVSLDSAVQTNPDQHAKVLDLSQKSGLAPSLVEGHEDEIDQKVRQRAIQYDKLIKDNPKLSQFLSDPNNAKLAHDDVKNLSWFEGNTYQRKGELLPGLGKVIENTPERFIRRAGGLMSMIGDDTANLEGMTQPIIEAAKRGEEPGLMDIVKTYTNMVTQLPSLLMRKSIKKDSFGAEALQYLSEKGRELSKEAQDEINRNQPGELGSVDQFAVDVARGTIDMLPMLAVGFITKSPTAGLSTMGVQVSGDVYADRLDKGVSPAEAMDAVRFNVFAEVVPESIPVMALLKKGSPFLKRFIEATLGEGAQEMITSVLEQTYDNQTLNDMSLKEAMLAIDWKQVMYEGAVGTAVGGTLSVPAHIASIASERKATDQQAVHNHDRLKELGERARESNLFTRNKEKFAEYVDQASDDAEVFLNVNDARELFQSANVNPAEVYKDLGVIDQVTEAAVSGGDLVIPLGKLAALADKPYFEEMIKDVRLSQGDISAREAEANQGEYEAYIQEVAKQAEERNQDVAAFTQSADQVYTGVKAELEATGKYSPDVIERYALLHRAFAVAMSDRLGMMPNELYQQYGLKVQDAAFTQDQKTQVERIRAGDVPEALKDADIANMSDREIIDAITPATTPTAGAEPLPSNLKPQEPNLDLGPTGDFDPAVFKFQAFQDPKAYNKNGEVVTDSEAFKKWFGDSKVVDENGEPLVVYHATRGNFDQFIGKPGSDLGFHFGTSEAASDRLEGTRGFSHVAGQGTATAEGENIMPVYLNIRYPLQVEDPGYFSYEDESFIDYLDNVPGIDVNDVQSNDDLISRLEEAGYDGLFYENEQEGGKSYVAFRPEQIKSAISNRGTFDPNDPRILYQSAYHGTPHTFDKFSLEAIGTGEGAQAYGWGLYFAGKKDIAEYYKNALAGDEYIHIVDGKPVNEAELRNMSWAEKNAINALGRPDMYRPETMVERLRQNGVSEDKLSELNAALKKYDGKVKFERKEKGNLYQADIPEDNELLDWDKPLSEQPEIVKEKLKKSGFMEYPLKGEMKDYYERRKKWGSSLYRGSELYNDIGYAENLTPRQVSEKLNSIGIPGLRYLDGSSRNKGEGSRNYVIWDENRVTVEAVNDELRQAQEYEQGTGDKRGSILIPKDFAESDAVIRLFENANLSTFLHESGHYFLEVYKDLVSRGTTPQALKDDFGALLDWMGVESADQIGVDQHEQFARAFEAYLFEGKAPSAELQSVFSRFRAWLVQVYRSIRNLDVKLTDEVRGVFDRMLATDEAIQQTEDYSLYLPLFKDANAAGMTEAEYNAYARAYTKAHDAAVRDLEKMNLDELRREEREAYKHEKEQVRNEVADRLAQNKAIRAKEFLMRGQFPQGDLPEGVEPFKLSKQALIAKYGTDGITRRLPQGKYRVTAEDGIDPDAAAAILGFKSGDELVQALANTPSYRQAVQEGVAAIMKERHGDLMGKPEEMAKAAVDATHNDERADFMMTELKALEKRANLKITPKQVVRNVAKRIISEKPASQLREGQYIQASIRAANEATRETAQGNYQAAADAKRRQILNHYLYMQARDARIKSEKIRKYMRRVQTRKYDAKRVNPAYITQLKLLANTYNFSKTADMQKAKQNLINLVRWVQSQQNTDGFIIPELLDPNLARIASAIELADSTGQDLNTLMDAIQIQPFNAMTIEELESVYNQARHLRFIGGQLSEASRAELAAHATYLADIIRQHGGKDVERVTEKSGWDKARDIMKRVSYDQVKLLTDISEFDGHEDFGPLFEAIYRPIVDGTNQRIEMDLKAINDLKAIFKPVEKALKPQNDILTQAKQKGGEWSLSLRQRVMLAVYWGSPESREAILQGHQVTEQDVHNILKTLTDEQLDLVNQIWEYNESYWPELSRIEAKVNGVPPVKVEHVPFEVNGRKMAGGYQRIFYHWDVRDKFKIDMNDEANKAMHMNKVTMSKTGATIARVGSGGREIRLDIDNVFRAVEDNLQFIAFAEASRKVAQMAQHPALANAIVEKYGQERYQSFIDAINGVFAGNVYSNHPINAMMRGVRTNLTFGYLALSIRNTVLQPFALANVMGKVGEAETLKAVADFYMHPMKWGAFIKERSPFMNQRNRYVNREASEQLARVSKGAGLGWRPQWAFIFQTMGDAVATYPAWLAGYRQGLKKFTAPGVSQETIESNARLYADEIVSSTVGSGLAKDLPPLFQGSGSVAQVVGPEAVKQLTFMGTFANMTYNLYFDAWKRADFKSVKSSANFVREMAWYSVIPGILIALVTEGLPDDDDDEGLWEWAAKASADYGFSASMFWRNFASAFKGFEPNIPATKAVTGSVYAFNLAKDIITDEKELDKAALAKFIRDFEPIIALPGAGQAARTLEYLDSFEQGNEDEFSLQGLLITGKKR